MKKYILILCIIIGFCSCLEDDTVDTTALPLPTATGANTFGCLVDGWVYVGGRHLGWGHSEVWTHDAFHYNETEDKLFVSVSVKPDSSIRFTMSALKEGGKCSITDVEFGEEELEDGTAIISRFDTKEKIISATFGNGNRLTHGRFDIHYTTLGTDEPQEKRKSSL